MAGTRVIVVNPYTKKVTVSGPRPGSYGQSTLTEEQAQAVKEGGATYNPYTGSIDLGTTKALPPSVTSAEPEPQKYEPKNIELTKEQEEQVGQMSKKELGAYLYATTTTAKQYEQQAEAQLRLSESRIKQGISTPEREQARLKRVMEYEEAKAQSTFQKTYEEQTKPFTFGGSGYTRGSGAGGTWGMTTDKKPETIKERFKNFFLVKKQQEKEQAEIVRKNLGTKYWPRYIIPTSDYKESQSLSQSEYYEKITKEVPQEREGIVKKELIGPSVKEGSLQTEKYSIPGSHSAFTFRTVQNAYTSFKLNPRKTVETGLLYYAGGLLLGGAGVIAGSGGPVASTTFKVLSSIGLGGYVGLKGYEFYSYEKEAAKLPPKESAGLKGGPNIISEGAKLGALSLGIKTITSQSKVEPPEEKLEKPEGLEYETKEYYPTEELTARSRSANPKNILGKELVKTLTEQGNIKTEYAEFLVKKSIETGEPVIITTYKAPKGQVMSPGSELYLPTKTGMKVVQFKGKLSSIGGIEEGFFVTTGEMTYGTYSVPSKDMLVNVRITPKTTTYKFLSSKTGEVLDIKTKLTLEQQSYIGKDIKINPEVERDLINVPGERYIVKATSGKGKFYRVYETKQGTVLFERLQLGRTAIGTQQITAEPPTTISRTYKFEVTEKPLGWNEFIPELQEQITSVKTTTTKGEPPMIVFGEEKLLPKEVAINLQKGSVSTRVTTPGKVVSRQIIKTSGSGRGQIVEVPGYEVPYRTKLDYAALKLISDKSGILLIQPETILEPPKISITKIPQPSVEMEVGGTISPSIFRELPGETIKQIPFNIYVSSPVTSTIQKPITELEPDIKPILKMPIEQDLTPILKQEQPTRQLFEQLPDQRLRQGQQIQLPPQETITIFQEPPPSTPKSPFTKEPLTIVPPPSPFELKKEEPTKRKGLYKVLVRRGGIFRTIGTARTPQQAFSIGRAKVETTAGASFKIEPTPRQRFVSPIVYYESKKEPGVFIQRRKFRISSFGEKREIPGKAAFLKRTKKIWGF